MFMVGSTLGKIVVISWDYCGENNNLRGRSRIFRWRDAKPNYFINFLKKKPMKLKKLWFLEGPGSTIDCQSIVFDTELV